MNSAKPSSLHKAESRTHTRFEKGRPHRVALSMSVNPTSIAGSSEPSEQKEQI